MINETHLLSSVTELMEKAGTILPDDVHDTLSRALEREREGSIARDTLETILQSARLSQESCLPLCQDTGVPLIIVRTFPGPVMFAIESAVREALRQLTEKGVLRQNCADPVTGRNTGDNIGEHVPQIHFLPTREATTIGVMFKGGGSENVSTQYALPHAGLGAGRDLNGVRKCALDAVFQAQGKGCSPGILGICIGGDRASGYLISKEALFHRLDLKNPSPVLAELEDTIVEQANSLGIGPMGLGGNTTLLGARVASAGRHPACYFVTVSYSCWATRRARIELNDEGGINRWL
jgi:fumarate hydratase class I